MFLAIHWACLGQLCDGCAGRYTRHSLSPEIVLKLQQESDRMKGTCTSQVWSNAQLMPATCLINSGCANYGPGVYALRVHQAKERMRPLEFAVSATTELQPNVRQRASAVGQEQLVAEIATGR